MMKRMLNAGLTGCLLLIILPSQADRLSDGEWAGTIIYPQTGSKHILLVVDGDDIFLEKLTSDDSSIPVKDLKLKDGKLGFSYMRRMANGDSQSYECSLKHLVQQQFFKGSCETKDTKEKRDFILEASVEKSSEAESSPATDVSGAGSQVSNDNEASSATLNEPADQEVSGSTGSN